MAFGFWDAAARPSATAGAVVQAPPAGLQEGEALPESASEHAWRAAKNSVASPPQELGFARQFLLTLPGVVLAMRLGRRAREINAPPAALAMAALPSLSCPLALYLLGGYPTGAALRAWVDGRGIGA